MGSRSKKQQPVVEPDSSSTASSEDAELSDTVLNGIRFGMNNVKKFIHDTLPKCSTDERKQHMAGRVEKLLLRLVKSEMTYTRASAITEEVVEEMPHDTSEDPTGFLKSCDDIADISLRRIGSYEKGLKTEHLKENETYIRLMKEMEIQLAAKCPVSDDDDSDSTSEEQDDEDEDDDDDDDDNNDDDEQEEEQEQEQQQDDDEGEEEDEEEEESDIELEVANEEDLLPTTDPITKQLLTDPVRNKKCGHIYGRATITQLIKKNNKTRCPIPGCSNNDFIRVSHLAADKKLTADIKQKQAEEQRKGKRR